MLGKLKLLRVPLKIGREGGLGVMIGREGWLGVMRGPVCFCILKTLLKKIKFFIFFLLQINIFLVFLDHFDVLILKIIFKK